MLDIPIKQQWYVVLHLRLRDAGIPVISGIPGSNIKLHTSLNVICKGPNIIGCLPQKTFIY